MEGNGSAETQFLPSLRSQSDVWFLLTSTAHPEAISSSGTRDRFVVASTIPTSQFLYNFAVWCTVRFPRAWEGKGVGRFRSHPATDIAISGCLLFIFLSASTPISKARRSEIGRPKKNTRFTRLLGSVRAGLNSSVSAQGTKSWQLVQL
jgi:hypothetical protein